MVLRDALEKQRWVWVALSLAMLACAAVVLWLTFRPNSANGGPVRAYFYDMSSDKLFAADRNGTAPAGPAAAAGDASANIVLAHVFSCGSCAAEADRFIGYLEMRDPQQSGPRRPERGVSRGNDLLVARPDGKDEWFGKNTDDGRRVLADGLAQCGEGKAPNGCTPP